MTRSNRYAVYGIDIESQLPLLSIGRSSERNATPAVSISLGRAADFPAPPQAAMAGPGDWIHHSVLADGSIYLSADGLLKTIVSADGRQAVCMRVAGADAGTFEANLLNLVLGTSLTLQGEEPLHATVVEVDGRAFGLLGDSGAGKSTLAAFLIAQGAKLITDDMLRLTWAGGWAGGWTGGRALAHRGPRRLKLFEETARRLLPAAVEGGQWNAISGKIMLQPATQGAAIDGPRPLAAMFWLGDPAGLPSLPPVTSRRLTGLDLAQVLIGSAMNVRFQAPERLVRQLKFAQRLAQVLPVYSLRYARRFELLDLVAREMRATMNRVAPPVTAGC